MVFLLFFFFKQKTAYEMRISDWSSDVGSSELVARPRAPQLHGDLLGQVVAVLGRARIGAGNLEHDAAVLLQQFAEGLVVIRGHGGAGLHPSSCSLRRLCPSGTWFAGRSGLS